MEQVRKPTDEQMQTLQVWRVRALVRMPYLASMIYALRVLDAPGLGTFAVDDHLRLYVDFAAVAGFTEDEGGQALLHEASHLLARHAEQAHSYGVRPDEQSLFGAAADLSINDDLRDGGCSMFVDGGRFLLPSTYGLPDHRTVLFYFDEMRRQVQSQTRASAGGGQDEEPGSSGRSDSGQRTGGESGDGDGGGPEGFEPFDGCGSGSGGPAAACELPITDDAGGHAPAASPAEREVVDIAVAAAITEYAAKGRGRVPAGLLSFAEQVMTPSVTPWQQVLASHFRRAVATKAGPFDADPSRRHRRRHRQIITDGRGKVTGRVVVPGTYTPDLTAEAIRDTSGSMSDHDLGVVTREIEAIAAKAGIRGNALRVTDVDAAVQHSTTFRGRGSLKQVHGRGGTSMTVGIEAACERRPRPAVIVVLTDGGTDWPQVKPPVPVVVALVAPEAYMESLRGSVPSWAKVVCIPASE